MAETTGSGSHPISSTSGFTLVELLIAMGIFLIVSLGALPLMITNMHVNQRNAMRNEAIRIADRWIEWLHSQDWRPNSTAAMNVPDVGTTADTIDPRFNYAIDCTQVVADRRFDCEVSVNWNYRGQAYSYAVDTIVIE